MQINWLIPTTGPEEIPFPILTYGNYGGPNFSGGEILGENEPADYTVEPEDQLDELFRDHDQVYDQPDTLLRALSDVALIQHIRSDLPEDAVSGEGDLYAGAAILAMLYQIAFINDHPELLLTLDLGDVFQDAADLIGQGAIAPEPDEVAGLVDWLEATGNALAAQDNPITDRVSERILDFAGSIGSDGGPIFPIVFEDAFDFNSENALALLTQAADSSPDAGDLGSLEDVLSSDALPTSVADAAPVADAAHLEALAHKLGEVHDFLL
jgi:hypothetical protein